MAIHADAQTSRCRQQSSRGTPLVAIAGAVNKQLAGALAHRSAIGGSTALAIERACTYSHASPGIAKCREFLLLSARSASPLRRRAQQPQGRRQHAIPEDERETERGERNRCGCGNTVAP
jgi:hypothetical protein